MTTKQQQKTLERAIQKALDNGWRVANPTMDTTEKIISWFYYPGGYSDNRDDYMMIIFNHSFAKALWGDELWWVGKPGKSGDVRQEVQIPTWQANLQQMVIAEDPITYLSENLPQ